MLLAAAWFPVLAHLTLIQPGGRLGSRTARLFVATVYLEWAIVATLLALFRDPYFDQGCWSNCTVNSFLVRSAPSLAHTVTVADRWFTVAAAAGLAVMLAVRLFRGSRPARLLLAPVAVPGLLLAGGVAAHSIALQSATEDPTSSLFRAIYLATALAVSLVGAGLVLVALRKRAQRLALGQTVGSLGAAPAPGSLEAALSQALGDPALRVAYWLPDSERYVDAAGQPVEAFRPGPDRIVTTLARDDRPIALVSHAGTLPDLEREMGPAIRLGLENERLQAEVLAQVEEIRDSRDRIVQTGDAERRRLERDLHDGAQQRLLALSFDIRLARSAAESDGEDGVESVLAEAAGEAHAALGELRELAHGIFPAILAEAGLEPALETLADRAPVPVELVGSLKTRLPASVEMAGYVLVVDAIQDAHSRGATLVTVEVAHNDAHLRVEVQDDGSPRTSPMVAVADRVGATGGTLEVKSSSVRADIPCHELVT
jgi:signal transduction histidine kinase